MVISFIEQGINCTRRNGIRKVNRPHLIIFSSEIDLLTNSMQSCLCLRYLALLIDCHRQAQGDNVVIRFTVSLSFSMILSKITNIQEKQQGKKSKGKLKEAR